MNRPLDQPPPLLPFKGLHGSRLRTPPPPKPGYLALLLMGALFLLIVGTVIWVLNIVGIIPGPWSSVFGAIFTSTGIIVAVLDSLLTVLHTERRHK